MRRRVSLDDDDYDDEADDDNNGGCGLSFYLYSFLAIFMLLSGTVLVMHRASRPRELDSVFEIFDVNLESQQKWLEK